MPVERQSEYETIYILQPGVDEETKKTVKERLDALIQADTGVELRFDDWGTRRLAYRVADKAEKSLYHEQGVYQYLSYLSPSQTVAELERNLRIMDSVLKFMTVKVESDLIPSERLARSTEEEEE